MGDLRDAFDATAKASSLIRPVDAALVEAGRKIADRIDVGTEDGQTNETATKAMYLVPHMVNILREMLATPATRKAAGVDDKETASGTLASLQAQRRKKRSA